MGTYVLIKIEKNGKKVLHIFLLYSKICLRGTTNIIKVGGM